MSSVDIGDHGLFKVDNFPTANKSRPRVRKVDRSARDKFVCGNCLELGHLAKNCHLSQSKTVGKRVVPEEQVESVTGKL